MKRSTMVFLFLVSSTCVVGDEMSFPNIMDAAIAGTPKLSAPVLLMTTDGSPILTEKHGLAAPALFDWDRDGDLDLLVGEFETNSSDFPMGADGSTIRVYANIGSNQAPEYDPNYTWAKDTEGTIMEVPQWCCIGFTPYFYDLNDDGYVDMITGQYHPGEVTWFRGSESGFLPGENLPQEGDPSSNWSTMQAMFADEDAEPKPAIETFDYWVYSSASMGDFDDDGDYDLIVGGSALRISENIGGKKRPSFAQRELLLDIHGNPLKVREISEREKVFYTDGTEDAPPAGDSKVSPYVVDWDQDGVLDLMVTDSYRSVASKAITYFRGVKTSDGHRFEPGVDLLPTADSVKALPGSGQRVYVADWNGDGVQDLLIGASIATVRDGEFSDELSWEWEDVNRVESAGKDPGLYPPRPKPTVESYRELFTSQGNEVPYTDEEIEEQVAMQVEYWEKDVGRLYKENKEHWLTMRHQGRIYVMLGSQREMTTTSVPASELDGVSSQSTTSVLPTDQGSSYPVQVGVSVPDRLTRGDIGQFVVDFDMAGRWYIYAPTGRNLKEDMVETSVDVSFPAGIDPQGTIKIPPYQYKGLFDIYTGQNVQFKQDFLVSGEIENGDHELCGSVTLQTCKDDLCLPPKTENYCATLAVAN